MKKELTVLTKVTKEVAGNLPGEKTIRYSGTYEPDKGLSSIHATVTREGRQVLTINRQREGQVGYNFSAGDDLKTMGTVMGEVLSDIDDLYDGAGSENVKLTVGNGIIAGVSSD